MKRAELFPFFRELSERGRKELEALATLRAAPNKRLLSRGDDAEGAFLVLAGALRVYYITGEGREATLYRVSPGSTCVLALSATLREQPYPAWVQAGSSGSVLVRVPGASFHRLLASEAAFRGFVLGALSERVFELMVTLEQLATSSVMQRVAAHLGQRAGSRGVLAVTQAALAAELGTAREVVFRALRSLAGQGLIATSRGRVTILDARGLARVAQRGA